MSDAKTFLSYFFAVIKENAAKILFYIVGFFLIVFFIKWLFTDGIATIFGSLFGPSKEEVIADQRATITQMADINETNVATIGVLGKAIENVETTLSENAENKDKSRTAFGKVTNEGKDAYTAAVAESKPVVVKAKRKVTKKAPSGQSEVVEEEVHMQQSELTDAHSEVSLKLANAQFDMLEKARCIASGACSA